METVRIWRLVIGLGIVSLAAGCGPSTMHVQSLRPTLYVQTRPGAGEKRIAVGAFEDARTDATGAHIGEAKTGAFNVSTKIIADEPVDVMVATVVRDGFQKAGFSIVEPSAADYIIMGQIRKFWVEEYATGVSFEYAKGFVNYDLFIKNAQGKIIWGNTIDQYIVSGSCWDATEFDIPTLTKALRASVEAIFQDDGFWQAITE